MPNPFDTLGAVDYNPQYQMGFIKKALKKVEKTARKVEQKVVPKKVREVRSKVGKAVKNNKLVQGAVVAAASAFGTPAAGMAVKSAFAAKNIRDSVKAGKVAKAEQKKLTQIASNPATANQARIMEQQGFAPSEIIKSFEKKPVKMDKRTARIKQAETKTATQALAPIAQELKENGFTDAQINAAWVNSEAFKNEAIKAAQSEAPAIAANLIASGMPQPQAQNLAPVIAAKQAADTVEQMREETTPSKLPLLFGFGLVAAILLSRRRG